MRALASLAAAVVLLGGCATYTSLSSEDRAQLERELAGPHADKYLRLSFYVTPFFGDASKKLLTAVPPEEVRLLNHPNGEPVNPGAVQKILPAGTRVRIRKVEFPTAFVVAERVVWTPRTQPWVYLDVENEPTDQPFILVLGPGGGTAAQVLSQIERYLVDHDPAHLMSSWPETVQAAVKTKTVVPNMPEDALEMALGYPEIKRVNWEGTTRKEAWLYPGNNRVAYLEDGRLVRLETTKR